MPAFYAEEQKIVNPARKASCEQHCVIEQRACHYDEHYDESSECAHVSINEVPCCRTERTLMGCADPLEGRKSAHPISILELTENEVVEGSRHWP